MLRTLGPSAGAGGLVPVPADRVAWAVALIALFDSETTLTVIVPVLSEVMSAWSSITAEERPGMANDLVNCTGVPFRLTSDAVMGPLAPTIDAVYISRELPMFCTVRKKLTLPGADSDCDA